MKNGQNLSKGNLYNKKARGVKTKGNKNPQEVFYESSLRLFRLLAHHPYFIAGASRLRKKYGITPNGITGVTEMLQWKNNHRKQYHRFIQDPALTHLATDFNIPPQLRRATQHFVTDFILLNRYDRPSMYETGLNIIRPSSHLTTLTLNLTSVYVEVTSATSIREIRDNWEKIVGARKQVRQLDVPKINQLDERVWELTVLREKELTSEEVTEQLRLEFPRRSFTYDAINKSRFRYKRALEKLRPLK